VLDGLRGEGLVTVNGTRGVSSPTGFPSQPVLLVTSEQPGSLEWTSFLATILDLIEKKETGIAGDVVALVGVDGREKTPSTSGCAKPWHGSVAGLLLMNSATVYLLPILQTPGIARVAIWAPFLTPAARSRFSPRSSTGVRENAREGQRIAVVSPHAHNLDAAQKRFSELGLPQTSCGSARRTGGMRAHHPAAFRPPDRPTRSSSPTTTWSSRWSRGFAAPKCKPGAMCTCLPLQLAATFRLGRWRRHIGFDVREVLLTAKECIDAQRAGERLPSASCDRASRRLMSFAKVRQFLAFQRLHPNDRLEATGRGSDLGVTIARANLSRDRFRAVRPSSRGIPNGTSDVSPARWRRCILWR